MAHDRDKTVYFDIAFLGWLTQMLFQFKFSCLFQISVVDDNNAINCSIYFANTTLVFGQNG
jgi:hypothetical protein